MPHSTFLFFVLMNSFLGTVGYPRGGGGKEYVLYIVLYWVHPLTLWIRHLDLDRKGAYFGGTKHTCIQLQFRTFRLR